MRSETALILPYVAGMGCVATVVALGWPAARFTRSILALALVWQLALIVTYWPSGIFGSSVAAGAGGSIALHGLPAHVAVLLGVVGLLVVAFVALFAAPGVLLALRLVDLLRSLRAVDQADIGAVDAFFASDPQLRDAWSEYRHGLRAPPRFDGHARSAEKMTSTTPAHLVFTPYRVFEQRLRTEFFRFLPGILTGIGIVGTFAGLIFGLQSFRISDDVAVVQRSLNALLSGAWESFLVSASAVTLAIIVTLVEKLILAVLHGRVSAVTRELDANYPVIAPDVHLAELIRLGELGNRELQLVRNAFSATATDGGLHAAAVSRLAPSEPATETRPAANTFELLGGLERMLKSQTEALLESNRQTIGALRSLASRFEAAAHGFEGAGRRSLDTLTSRLAQAQSDSDARNQMAADRIQDVLSRLESLTDLFGQRLAVDVEVEAEPRADGLSLTRKDEEFRDLAGWSAVALDDARGPVFK
jgi:hypothetical protein